VYRFGKGCGWVICGGPEEGEKTKAGSGCLFGVEKEKGPKKRGEVRGGRPETRGLR